MIIEFYVAVKIAVRNPRGAVSRRFPSNYSMMIAQRPRGKRGYLVSHASQTPIRTRARELTLLTIFLAALVSLLFVAWLELEKRIPTWVFFKTQLIFLITLEIVYVLTLVGTLIATPVLCSVFLRGRRAGTSGQSIARWLLSACSLLLGFGLAEAVSAVREYRSHQSTVMPIGGLREIPRSNSGLRFVRLPQEIDLPTNFTDAPGEKVIDLVVLGESSAEGVPFRDWLSIGKIIAWQLGKSLPGRPIRLTTSCQVRRYPGDAAQVLAGLRQRPEILIIYCGHNEFQSRLFAFGEQPTTARPDAELLGSDRRWG